MQLRQGQARRIVVKLRPVHNSGQLPLMLEEVVAVGDALAHLAI